MNDPDDNHPLTGNGRPDSTNPEPLQNFVEGLSRKIGSEFGRVSSHEKKREVKREIARQLGVEETYVPQIRSSANDSDAARQARRKVRDRYWELRRVGKIVEDGEVAEQTERFNEWVERLIAHTRGEECFYSEDIPHANWVEGEPSGDPSEEG